MQEKRWLKKYAEGVPYEVDCSGIPSVRHLFEGAVSRYRSLPAFSNMGTTLTYAEVEQLSRAFAAYLQNDLGLVKGDRLAIMLPNLLQYPVVLFGAFLAGLVIVNVNPQYTPRELQRQLLDAEAHAIVVLENFAHTVEAAAPGCALRVVITTRVGDLLAPPASFMTNFVAKYVRRMVPRWNIPGSVALTDVLNDGRKRELRPVALAPEDIAFLQYTSGTTGVPKGAILTHGNVVANVRQNNVWCGKTVMEGEEIVVTPLPLYHVLSLMVNLLAYFNFGGHDILVTDPRDVKGLVRELRKSRFSVITAVNTLYSALLNEPSFSDVDVGHLRSAVAGGAAVQSTVAERWKARTGIAIVEGYGLTEAGVLTCNPLDSAQWNGTVGLPYPSTEISIRDEAGDELAPGQVGEICARGPQVMKGYWRRPDETAAAFLPDGWLRTGDMGFLDQQGWLTVVDRKKDMIVVSGLKVYPTEIEDALALHPGVKESAAIGVPDERSGEAVKLLVVRKNPGVDAAALMAHCRTNLAAYKCPKYIEFTTDLPKTQIGKVLRRQLRAPDDPDDPDDPVTSTRTEEPATA